jgi:hypothetical protein
MSELTPSPFTCAKCGKVAMWEKIQTDAKVMEIRPGGKPLEGGCGFDWWLNIPCECGSSLFKVQADPTKFVGSYGTGE